MSTPLSCPSFELFEVFHINRPLVCRLRVLRIVKCRITNEPLPCWIPFEPPREEAGRFVVRAPEGGSYS
jgi:hypothetical protein